MTKEEIRVECLKIAVGTGTRNPTWLAQHFIDFVINGVRDIVVQTRVRAPTEAEIAKHRAAEEIKAAERAERAEAAAERDRVAKIAAKKAAKVAAKRDRAEAERRQKIIDAYPLGPDTPISAWLELEHPKRKDGLLAELQNRDPATFPQSKGPALHPLVTMGDLVAAIDHGLKTQTLMRADPISAGIYRTSDMFRFRR